MTEQEEKEILEAKLANKKRLHQFLEYKLIWLNWILFIMWLISILTEILSAFAAVEFVNDSELFKVVIIGLIALIPILFAAEGIGIYRKWGVSIDLDEVKDGMDLKGGK